MSKHTPGPWAVDDKTGALTWGDISFGAPVGAGGFVVASHSVCNIPKHKAERLTDEHHANARLIAAAPDLLAALTGVLQHCVTPRGMPDNGKGRTADQQTALDAARAAIAKAGG